MPSFVVSWQFCSQDIFELGISVKDELFHLGRGFGYSGHVPNVWASSTEVGRSEITEAKDFYQTLVNLDSNVFAKLQIPIDRWIKSKAEDNPVDKVIDLGIAFESLYLSGIDSKTELRFRFSLHAAWHLGKNKEQRRALMKEFKAIYDWRSTLLFTQGKLPNKRKRKKEKIVYSTKRFEEFIRKRSGLMSGLNNEDI